MFEIEFGFLPQIFFLVLARIAGLMGTLPFYGGAKVPMPIRLALALIIALLVTPMVSSAWVVKASEMTTLFGLLIVVLSEVMLGAAIGLVCQLFSTIFVVTGVMAAQSSGLMMAQELDPLTSERNNLLSQLVQTIFVLLVVIADGHLVLLRLVTESFYNMPPQIVWVTQGWTDGLIALAADMYEWGVKLGAPVVGTIFIVNVGFGLIAKAAPSFNILFLSMPVRLGVSLLVFGNLIQFSKGFYDSVIARMLEACSAFFV